MRSPTRILTAMLAVSLIFVSLAGTAGPATADAPRPQVDSLDRPARSGDTFEIDPNSQTATAAFGAVVSIRGAGWGHGIGLSQYGAQARAVAGQTREQVIESYYTGATVGSFGDGSIPTPATIFTNVASDLTSTTLAALAGPVGPRSGVTVTRLVGGGDPVVATLFPNDTTPNDTMVITDTTPQVGALGGCTATLTISGVETVWDAGSCDFDVALTAGDTTPTDLIHATNCRTVNCTFGYGTALHIVDNASSQRTVTDPFAGFDLVVESTLDEYTRGIAEVPFSWDMVALEAQSIASRSYAASFVVSTDHRSRGCFCDVRNSSVNQVYAGWIGDRTMADRWDLAATTTAGMVVADPSSSYAGIVRAFYSSSNGGASENNEDLWGGTPLSYLRSVDDPFSLAAGNPRASWQEDVPIGLFSSKLGFDVVTDVTIVNRFDSGTPKVIEVTGLKNGDIATECFGLYEPCVTPQSVVVGSGAGEIFDNLFGLYSTSITSIVVPGDPAAILRWWGQDRYATAAEVSKAGFPDGANTVYIATGTNFPDALAAAPLAVKDPGPVLLVRHDSIPSSTSAEIARLGPNKIVVLGGASAISETVETTLSNYAVVDRIAGADRYSTAADLARSAFPGHVETVYVAVGTSFADALVAAPAAASQGAPVVLVQPNAIPEPTRTVLNEMGPSKIVVIGGGTSISQSVVDQLGSYSSGSVVAIAGSDRYATSALVAAYAYPNGADSVFVATGLAFPDALTAGAVAGALNGPLLLVQTNSIPGSVALELVSLDPTTVVILGGTDAVGQAVIDEINLLVG